MVTVFLPIRKGSERVKNKNFRKFSKYQYGIYELKINQLISCPKVNKIIVSTTDDLAYDVDVTSDKLCVISRPEHLGQAATKTDELVKYALNMVDSEWFLWTHATSPLFDEHCYSDFIEKSTSAILNGNYDSSATVTELKSYLFKSDITPIFDRKHIKWPATQSLEAVYEINNAAFFGKTEQLRLYNDRLGEKPFFYKCNKIESTDIDWEEDFRIAEILYEAVYGK